MAMGWVGFGQFGVVMRIDREMDEEREVFVTAAGWSESFDL
jgi:hypothetical protein